MPVSESEEAWASNLQKNASQPLNSQSLQLIRLSFHRRNRCEVSTTVPPLRGPNRTSTPQHSKQGAKFGEFEAARSASLPSQPSTSTSQARSAGGRSCRRYARVGSPISKLGSGMERETPSRQPAEPYDLWQCREDPSPRIAFPKFATRRTHSGVRLEHSRYCCARPGEV
jgi:hypothetical protein